MSPEQLVVGIAEGGVVRCGGELVSHALGSCVGICLYDRTRHIAGMAHILLPSRGQAVEQSNPYKFADSGTEALIRAMERQGAVRSGLTAKLAGGARMFRVGDGQCCVGERNIAAARQALLERHIPILAQDVGEDYGRSICFCARTGALHIRTVRAGERTI